MKDKTREEINKIAKKNILAASNYIDIFGLYDLVLERSIHYSELWFKCPHCEDYFAAEQMFFIQTGEKEDGEQEGKMQSFSTFLPLGNQPGGFDDHMEIDRPIGTSCIECLNSIGVNTDPVPITHLPFDEDHLV